MKVGILCEYSGTVRDAFRRRGHDAISCDLLPTERPGCACCDLPAPRVCVENPFGLPVVEYRRPDQVIHPYYFGDPAHKRTCLWLRGLPALEHSEQAGLFGQPRTHVPRPRPAYIDSRGKARHFVDSMGRHPDRWKIRSKTFEGIAQAMAEQWGALDAAAEAAA